MVSFDYGMSHREILSSGYITGGPHSSFAGDFSAYIAVFYSLGYSVLLLNFRGSSGYGQDSIESLPGHISIYDVQDCQVNSRLTSSFTTYLFN